MTRYLVEHQLLIDKSSRIRSREAEEAEKASQPLPADRDGPASDSAEGSTTPTDLAFDPAKVRHKGQYALRRLYHESEGLIGVLYSSPTCGPCRMLKPILARVVEDSAGGSSSGGAQLPPPLHFVEIDIVEDPEIAEAAGVMGTPTVHFFRNKERVAVLTGVKGKGEYASVIQKHLKGAAAAGVDGDVAS